MKMKLHNFYVRKNVWGGLMGFFGGGAKHPQAPPRFPLMTIG